MSYFCTKNLYQQYEDIQSVQVYLYLHAINLTTCHFQCHSIYNFRDGPYRKDSLKNLGLNNPHYDPSEQKLGQQNVEHDHIVEHDHNEDGLRKPRLWEGPSNVEIFKFSATSKHKVKVDGEIIEISNTIPKNKFGKKIFILTFKRQGFIFMDFFS